MSSHLIVSPSSSNNPNNSFLDDKQEFVDVDNIEFVDEIVEEVYEEQDEDEEININNVDREIEVDTNNQEWIIPLGSSVVRGLGQENKFAKKKLLGAPNTVLRTVDDLRVRPRLHVKKGKYPSKWEYNPLSVDPQEVDFQVEVDPNEPSTSSIPSIRPALRLFASAALKHAEEVSMINDIHDETLEFEPDFTQDSDHPPRDSRRGQRIFYHRHWPLYNDRAIDFQEACEILCGALEIEKKEICTSIPQLYKNEGTFIVDLRAMKNRHDVHGDGLGTWGKPNGKVRFYSRRKSGQSGIVRADDGKGKIRPGHKYLWKCMMKRYEHPSTAAVNNGENRFIKKIYTALYPSEVNKAVGLAVITYEWFGRQPFDFLIPGGGRLPYRRPHGSVPPHGTTWESNSFHNRIPTALPSTISGFFGDIPIYAEGAVDFNTAAAICLGGVDVDSNKIATSVPQGYKDPGTFVIDMTNFQTDALLRRDDNGIWGKPAGTSRYYTVDDNSGDALRMDDKNRPPAEGYDIQVLCKRYEHPATGGKFVRKIYTTKINSSNIEQRTSLAVISYFWKGEPVPFEVRRQYQVNKVNSEALYDNTTYSTYQAPPSPSPSSSSPIKRSRTDMSEGIAEKQFRQAVWKKEYENQIRFSALLDRAEAFLGRLEATSGNMLYTQENGESSTNFEPNSLI